MNFQVSIFYCFYVQRNKFPPHKVIVIQQGKSKAILNFFSFSETRQKRYFLLQISILYANKQKSYKWFTFRFPIFHTILYICYIICWFFKTLRNIQNDRNICLRSLTASTSKHVWSRAFFCMIGAVGAILISIIGKW